MVLHMTYTRVRDMQSIVHMHAIEDACICARNLLCMIEAAWIGCFVIVPKVLHACMHVLDLL